MIPENIISSLAIFYVGVPLFLFVAFQNFVTLKVTILILVSDGITALLKLLTQDSNTKWLKRPLAAEGCNLQMTGRQGGTPGFPSGHLATTTSFWTCMYFLTPTQYRIYIAGTGVILSAAMIWSRMKKSCHTLLQCIAGSLLGIGVAYIGMRWV